MLINFVPFYQFFPQLSLILQVTYAPSIMSVSEIRSKNSWYSFHCQKKSLSYQYK